MSEPLRIGLLGAGGIAEAYADVFADLPAASLTVVCDIDPLSGRRLAEASGARFVAQADDVSDVDAVIICTPPNTHPELAVHFLKEGVPVLCEKPLAIDVPSALLMAAESARTGTILTMASKFRYVPDITAARSIIKSGILGEIILYENSFASHVDMTDRWNSRPEVSGGGVLIDNGTHSLDIARYLLGSIEQVLAVEGKRVQSIAVEDTASIFFTTVDGVTGTIDLSWSVNKERDSFIEIYGSHGTIRIGWNKSVYRQSSSSEWVQFGSGYDKLAAMTAEVNNFVGAVLGTEELLITAEDGIASVAVVAAAYHSLNSPSWVAVEGELGTSRDVA